MPVAKWYEDPTRTTYTTTYESDQELTQELGIAVKYGWLPETTARIHDRNRRNARDREFGSRWSVTYVRKSP
jgi:hypothetical protein